MKAILNIIACASAVALTFIVCCTDVMAESRKWHCALPLIRTDPIVCLDARVYTCPSAQNVKDMKATLEDLALGALLRYYYYDSKTARHHLNGYRYRIGR